MVDERGVPASINVSSEVFLSWAIVVVTFGNQLPVWPISWIFGGAVAIILLVWQKYKADELVSRDGMLRLTEDELQRLPALTAMISHFELVAPPSIIVDTTDRDIAASARRGTSGDVLLLSAGLLAEIGRASPRATAIVAHELAHVANQDWRALILITAVKLSWWWWLASIPLAGFLDGASGAMAAIYSCVGVAVLYYIVERMVSRREFFADAAAMNVVKDVSEYQHIISSGASDHLVYHPSSERRLQSMNGYSRNFSFNWSNIFIGLYLASVAFGQSLVMAREIENVLPTTADWAAIGGISAVILALAVLVSELKKPMRPARPTVAVQASVSRQHD